MRIFLVESDDALCAQRSFDLLSSILPLALVCATSRASVAESNPQEEAAITKTAEAFVEAFQKGDAKAVAAFWTPDGYYVDATGRVLQGRSAIEKAFENFFAENKGLKLPIEVASLKFPTPNTAVEDGTTGVVAPEWYGPEPGPLYQFLHEEEWAVVTDQRARGDVCLTEQLRKFAGAGVGDRRLDR